MSGLVKAKKYDVADSNIAMLGSDVEKNARLNAAQTEAAWQGVGKEVGFDVWRIEKFQVVRWPNDKFGTFFSGDSYIVLRTYKKPDEKKFSYDVHFWLGKETTQDEAGTAAYKTVELDDFLGGVPVQHREVMGHESELFMSYFPKINIQEGGVDSGFRQVKPEEYRPRLLHVKGNKTRVVVREVEKNHGSLNSGDVFVLDCGLKIFQFNGKQSSGIERHKASELCRALDVERKGLAKQLVINEDDADMEQFWEALGDKGPIKSSEEGGTDAEAGKDILKRLFRLSDASGTLEFKEEASGKIRKSMFDTNDCFVFDAGHEVFVWLGKKATAQEKRHGITYASDYLKKYNRPAYLPISRVLEGGENEVFNDAIDPEESKGYVPKKVNKEKKEGDIPAPVAQK
eukprot:Partr_v1_DN28827_c1_g1_i5_m33949 putative gelsolin